MSGQKVASWAYAEDFVGETVALDAARARGEQLGATPVLAGTGAALRMLAAACHAKTIVEIGSGAGVSGLWILEGMPADGVLTTIEIQPEHGRAAKQAFAQAAELEQVRSQVETLTQELAQKNAQLADLSSGAEGADAQQASAR